MEKIAFISGETIYYWSSIVLTLATLTAICFFWSLYLGKGGNGIAAFSVVPLAIALSLLLGRLVHWYCRTSSYDSFEAAMMKAVSSIELGMDTLTHKPFEELTDDEIVAHLHVQDAERVFCVYEALKRGIDHKVIYDITKIDWWFLDKMQHLADLEKGLAQCNGVLSLEQYKTAKKYGFQDKTIRRLAQVDTLPVENYRAGFKMVDTCAAEFSANTPYFYSTYDGDNEAASYIAEQQAKTAAKGAPKKKKVLVFASSPHRNGPGIAFH